MNGPSAKVKVINVHGSDFFLKGENIVLKCWDYIQGLSKTSVDIKLGPKKRTVWSNFEVNDPVKDSPAKRLLLPDFLPVKKIALKSIPDYLDTRIFEN